VIFSAPDRTLDGGEIDEMHKKVIADLNRKGYILR
jgi:hypothetical protein